VLLGSTTAQQSGADDTQHDTRHDTQHAAQHPTRAKTLDIQVFPLLKHFIACWAVAGPGSGLSVVPPRERGLRPQDRPGAASLSRTDAGLLHSALLFPCVRTVVLRVSHPRPLGYVPKVARARRMGAYALRLLANTGSLHIEPKLIPSVRVYLFSIIVLLLFSIIIIIIIIIFLF
jgi:hypothetical protein